MALAALKLGFPGAASDTPNGTSGSAPATNGTWANFISGTAGATADGAQKDAGYIEFPGIDNAGAACTFRVPVFKV